MIEPYIPITALLTSMIGDGEEEKIDDAVMAFWHAIDDSTTGAILLGISRLMQIIVIDHMTRGDETGAAHCALWLTDLLSESVDLAEDAVPGYAMSENLREFLGDRGIDLAPRE